MSQTTPTPASGTGLRARAAPFSSIGSLLVSRLAAGAATLVVLIGAARLLSVEAVGALGLALSLGLLYAAITEGGVWMTIVRDLARDPGGAGRYVGALFGLRLALAPPLALALVVISTALYGVELVPAIMLGATAAYVQTLSASVRGMLIAIDRTTEAGALQTLEAVTWAACLLAAAALTGTAIGMLATSCVVYAALLGIGLARLRSATPLYGVRAGLLDGRGLLVRSRSFAVFTIGTVALTQVEIVTASVLLPLASVAVLQVALRLLYVTDYLHDSVGQWAYPKLSRARITGPSSSGLVDRLLGGLAVLGMPVGLLLFVVGARLVPLLFGAAYEPAADLVRVLAIAVPVRYVAQGYGTILSAGGRQASRSAAVMGALALAIVLQAWIVTSTGIEGIPVGTCITWLALTVTYWWAARDLSGSTKAEVLTAVSTSLFLIGVAIALPVQLEAAVLLASIVAVVTTVILRRRRSPDEARAASEGTSA